MRFEVDLEILMKFYFLHFFALEYNGYFSKSTTELNANYSKIRD